VSLALEGPGLTSTLHVILLARILSIWLLYVIHFWTSEGPWTYLNLALALTSSGPILPTMQPSGVHLCLLHFRGPGLTYTLHVILLARILSIKLLYVESL
jgi:hypothetical protein